MVDFIVTGLPRSGTTWLSVFLTTDDCICLHDPTAEYSLDILKDWEGGICDTGIWYYDTWCKEHTDKIILIDRKEEDVIVAMKAFSLSLPEEVYREFQEKKHSFKNVIYFENLFTEEAAEDIWTYIYPDKPFNKNRWLHLKEIYMSPLEVEKRGK